MTTRKLRYAPSIFGEDIVDAAPDVLELHTTYTVGIKDDVVSWIVVLGAISKERGREHSQSTLYRRSSDLAQDICMKGLRADCQEFIELRLLPHGEAVLAAMAQVAPSLIGAIKTRSLLTLNVWERFDRKGDRLRAAGGGIGPQTVEWIRWTYQLPMVELALPPGEDKLRDLVNEPGIFAALQYSSLLEMYKARRAPR